MNSTLQSILAVAAGVVTVLAIVFGTILLLTPDLMAGGTFPVTASGRMLVVTLEVIGGAAGAFVAALLAPRAPRMHGWTLGALIFVLNVLTVVEPDSAWPMVPAIFLVAFVPLQTWVGIALAERLRARFRGTASYRHSHLAGLLLLPCLLFPGFDGSGTASWNPASEGETHVVPGGVSEVEGRWAVVRGEVSGQPIASDALPFLWLDLRAGPTEIGKGDSPNGRGSLPRALPNDQRTPAGRLVEGVLHVELEAVEAEWYPRGPDGPRVVTAAFAEVGGPPQVPGPLIRAAAGTPVRVTIHNTLPRTVAVRGLLDRATAALEGTPPPPLPAFVLAEPLTVLPGETREAGFRSTEDVSSFYYAQAVPPGSDGSEFPFGDLGDGAFMGALVVDPPGVEPPPDERVLMITRWGSNDEPGMEISWKMMMNGRSWPFTERLEYTAGDSVRWRVINASMVDHPMHLHGFFFEIDAVGDTQADSAYAPGDRPLVVTHMMQEFSSLRLTWVPEEPGNWLFHCHLIRHMGELQRFQAEREAAPSLESHDDEHAMEGMAGLVTGITVRPSADYEPPDEVATRRIDLWTGTRPDVYEEHPELGFVVQEGAQPPAADSTHVPGSPLILTRGERTEIVVHNRLDFPLSVHWHGLELPSLYDGVGGWSGSPGMTRPAVAPGDTAKVFITPPRAGTFMYHTHGEPEHELSQGLYGAFLVLRPGEERDADADRSFVLASRGAARDAAPAINGEVWPERERFEPGASYRLRFLHISPDAFKRVRLVKDGEPVRWRAIAKDGADLPETSRALQRAVLGIGVGETYDVSWTPEERGVYVLEVTTEFYPSVGGFVTQRIAFGVGDVSDEDLRLPGNPELPAVALSAEELAGYGGMFIGSPPEGVPDPVELLLSVWEEGDRLYSSGILIRDDGDAGGRQRLLPLGEHAFMPGRDLEGLFHATENPYRYRFVSDGGVINRLELDFLGGFAITMEPASESDFTEEELRRFMRLRARP